MTVRRGSALIVALWIIAVLSVMVFSFAFEAHQQAGINVYVRERNRVSRLIEPGRVIGETVLLGFNDAKPWSDGENPKELDEEDRFYLEKRALKFESKCTIGPILLDEEDEESGTVTIEIRLANSGESNGINVNELYSGGDKNYALRWQMILKASGIDEELEVDVPEADGRGTKRHNLMNLLIASWNNWRDTSTSTKGPLADLNPQEDDGADEAWYKQLNERLEDEARGRAARNAVKEEMLLPRNGAIPDVKELASVRGFRDFPAVLTGGLLHPDVDESEENPRLKGIVNVFGTSGSAKVNVNDCTVEQLMTVPGVFNEEATNDGDTEESEEIARAIVETRSVMPDGTDVDESRDWWPYADWQDLCQRVSDNANVAIGTEAKEYLCYTADENTVFKMTIVAESMGMKHEVTCECYVKDKKVRYLKWRED